MKQMTKKLRSRAGESIGETLVALLISALALMMLAGAVSTATNVVMKSKTTMSEYYQKDNQLANASGGNDLTVTLTDTSTEGTPSPQVISANYKLNDVLGVQVVAYAAPTPAPEGS